MGEPTATAPSPGAAEQAREKKPAAGAANDDRYAAFLSRARTTKAQDLILLHIYNAVAQWEGHTGTRQRQRLSALGPFVETLERFVGDLLRARTGKDATGRIYHSLGKMSFDDDPVTYDHFMRALEALKALDLIAQSKSHRRYTKAFGKSFSRPGRAPRFWATDKLVGLARQCGITDDNVHDHFRPELPTNVLVLRDYSPGRGANKERGPIIRNYDRTPTVERLEADVLELNEFLSRQEIRDGRHHAYNRTFNNKSWNKGGRLSSIGPDNYQQMSEERRLQMWINREHVAEIDIRASHLTAYHAKVGMPLEGDRDPYLRIKGVDRDVAKLWTVLAFGNSKPPSRWPSKTIQKFKKDTGQDLRKWKLRELTPKILAAFPAFERLERFEDIWADLQYIESNAVVGTMLLLMREHHVPSLSMHDGLIVPWSKGELAKTILR